MVKTGYGYAISPSLNFDFNGIPAHTSPLTPINTSRIALTDNNQTTSSLSVFENGRPDGRVVTLR